MDAYKEKEYEVRRIVDDVSCLSGVFENYVAQVNNFIDREIKSYIELSNKEYLLRQKYNATKEEINKIIFEIEHNKRANAEIRDKYIVEKLNNLLKESDK